MMLKQQQMAAAQNVAGRRFALARPAVRRAPLSVKAGKVSVGDLSKADLEGKRVLVRSDLNVPMDKNTGGECCVDVLCSYCLMCCIV